MYGIKILIDTESNGNIDSTLGGIQDVKFCMENNLLAGIKSPIQVEELVEV